MSVTLIREFAARDAARLSTVLADLAKLPDQLAERRKQLFRDVAMNRRAAELHEGREEYRRIYDDYIGVAERYQALAEAAGSPLAAEFESVAEAIRQQRDDLFGRWRTLDDLYQVLIKDLTPSAERLKAFAARSPPPQSWFDETDDPFSAD